MDLYWDKLKFTWIVALTEHADGQGKKFKRPPDKDIHDLCVHLLNLGGVKVCIFFVEKATCQYFLTEGQLFHFRKLLLKTGPTGHCHTDSVAFWRKHPGKYHIMTGYGLSDDGMWRRHSWLMTDENVLVETTIQREMYFGVMVADSQVSNFAQVYSDEEY